jgi:DNA-binding MurR/RpiR family transcriptional regulator
VIAVLGGLADVERDRRRWAEDETLEELAKSCNVGKPTISRLAS